MEGGEIMGKKKNQTPEEREIHQRAITLRKMTDEQLVRAFEESKSPKPSAEENKVERFIEAFERADVPNIGKVTIKKIKVFAEENGFI